MLSSIDLAKNVGTEREDQQNEVVQGAYGLCDSTVSSVCTPSHGLKSPYTPTRTTRIVLEDIFFTYTGCRTTENFFSLQKDGVVLQRRIRQGWNIPNAALQPVVPEGLLLWYTNINSKRQLIYESSLCSSALNTSTQCYPKQTFAEQEKHRRRLLRLFLPSLESLPAPKRCNLEAVMVMRDLVGQHLRHLLDLVDTVLHLKNRWGRLDEHERNRISKTMRAAAASRVRGLATLQKGFLELNFSKLGLYGVSEEMANYSEVRILRLNNNKGLKYLPVVPPACQMVFAGACNLEAVGCVPKPITPSQASNFSQVLVMGLPYNRISSLHFIACFPSLHTLDLTGNQLDSMGDVLSALREHAALVDIYLAENPISLLDGYRHFLVKSCPKLVQLDGQPIRAEERTRNTPFPVDFKPFGTQALVERRRPRDNSGQASVKKNVKLSFPCIPLSGLYSSSTENNRSDSWPNTVFLSAQILAIRHFSSLSHTPFPVASIDELLPLEADFWRQVSTAKPCVDSRSIHDPAQQTRPSLARIWGMQSLHSRLGNSKPVQHAAQLYTHMSFLTLRGGWGPTPNPASDGDYHVPIILTDISLSTSMSTNGIASCKSSAERSNNKMEPPHAVTSQASKMGRYATAHGGAAARALSNGMIKEDGDVYYPPADRAIFTQNIPIRKGLCESLARDIRLRVEVHDTVQLSCGTSMRTPSRGNRQDSGLRNSQEPQATRRNRPQTTKGLIGHIAPTESSEGKIMEAVDAHMYYLGDVFLQPGSLLGLPSTSSTRSELVLTGRLLLSEADRRAELRALKKEQATLRKALEAYIHACEAMSIPAGETSEWIDKDNSNHLEPALNTCRPSPPPLASRQSYANTIGLSSQLFNRSDVSRCIQRVLSCGARVIARLNRLEELYKAADKLEIEIKLCIGCAPINPALHEVVQRKGKSGTK